MSEGFLSRWARRKEAVRSSEQVARSTEAPDAEIPGALPDPAEPIRSIEAASTDSSAETADDPAQEALAELPSLDALTPATDLSPFLRAGVPAALRNAALRRMWSLDPAIRDFVSEAREYAYDWNVPGGAPGFGPLLQGDDVKAMLGRLFGASDQPDATTRSEDEAAPELHVAGGPETDVAGPEPELAADEAVLLPQREGHAETPIGLQAEPVPEMAAEPVPERPRLRRHGGAMPV